MTGRQTKSARQAATTTRACTRYYTDFQERNTMKRTMQIPISFLRFKVHFSPSWYRNANVVLCFCMYRWSVLCYGSDQFGALHVEFNKQDNGSEAPSMLAWIKVSLEIMARDLPLPQLPSSGLNVALYPNTRRRVPAGSS